jgi:hypothetical protein
LAVSPDGSLLQAPRALLAHTPFSTFLIPGLLLLFVVGGSSLRAAFHVARDAPGANTAAVLAGGVLLIWIVVEMVLFRSVHWAQIAYLVVGSFIVLEALRRRASSM